MKKKLNRVEATLLMRRLREQREKQEKLRQEWEYNRLSNRLRRFRDKILGFFWKTKGA